MAATKTTLQLKQRGLYKQYPHEFKIWAAMHQRCRNPNSQGYKYYGARGIKVCDRWTGKDGFRNFIGDMDAQPFPRASIERRNNKGNYCPDNVCWADAKAQARNMSRNRLLTYKGQTMPLAAWAEAMGMKPGTLWARLEKGWPIGTALTKPVEKRRPFSPWANRRIKP